jgi:hypothetical protein
MEKISINVKSASLKDIGLKNKPGKLFEIEKNALTIEQSYQRQSSESDVGKIAGNWFWPALGTIVVSHRNGQYYVVDGQHRVLAAKMRDDVEMLPCIVHEGMSVEEEAAMFYLLNNNRRTPTAIEKFKAILAANDDNARYVNSELTKRGFVVAKSGSNTTNCIQAMMMSAKKNKKRFVRALELCVNICQGQAIPKMLFSGLDFVDSKREIDKALSDRLVDVGFKDIAKAIRHSVFYENSWHPRSCAKGIMSAANEGSKNKIEIAL